MAKVIWSDNLRQGLKRTKTALLALLLAFPLHSHAADRAPTPPGEGWIHVWSDCVEVGNYCKSNWIREAGRRGKITYVDSAKTHPGQSDKSRAFVMTYAVNCDMWERKIVSPVYDDAKWKAIPLDSGLDEMALLVCN